MRILAIETVTDSCSVALENDGHCYYLDEICSREHSKRVLSMVQQVLLLSQLNLVDLDAIAYSCGPGSFTGMRISLGITQGLAFGAELPIIGISTLATLAQGAYRLTGKIKVAVAMNARANEIYWAEYHLLTEGWHVIFGELPLTLKVVSERMNLLNHSWALAGNAWQSYASLLAFIKQTNNEVKSVWPMAKDMLVLAKKCFLQGQTMPVQAGQLNYLCDATNWKKMSKSE